MPTKSDTAMQYAIYAQHCLMSVLNIPDQASRMIHREMAAEWFKLADQASRVRILSGATAVATKAAKG
jgi:hypothetical protein